MGGALYYKRSNAIQPPLKHSRKQVPGINHYENVIEAVYDYWKVRGELVCGWGWGGGGCQPCCDRGRWVCIVGAASTLTYSPNTPSNSLPCFIPPSPPWPCRTSTSARGDPSSSASGTSRHGTGAKRRSGWPLPPLTAVRAAAWRMGPLARLTLRPRWRGSASARWTLKRRRPAFRR